MIDIEKKNQISESAGFYFENGFHCAEAVVASVLEGLGHSASNAVAHATAFGGGMGRTFEETCGALSGSLIVIGHFFGRQQQGVSWDAAAMLGATIRQRFLDGYATTHCGTLKNRFGEKDQEKQCALIVRVLAADLFDLLQENKDL